MRALISRLGNVLCRRSLDRRMEEEYRFHLEAGIEANLRRGMTQEQASRAAQRVLGNAEKIREECRDQTGLPTVEVLFKDLQYAVRTFGRSAGFTLTAILSLGLGIGANTAIFTLTHAVMMRSLPVSSPDDLVSVGDAARPTALRIGAPMANIFSYPLYERIRIQNHVFSGLLASGRADHTEIDVGNGVAQEAHCRLVSSNYFAVLGVPALLGRTFGSRSADAAVVISYGFWATHLGHDPNVLGSTLRVNGYPYTVIGIGPPGFTGEVVGSPADIWIPLSMEPQVNGGGGRLHRSDANWLLCLGRLKPGVSIARARAEVTTLVREALVEFERAGESSDKLREIRSQTVEVEPGGKGFSWIRKHDAPMLLTLMVMAGLVLLITCANIATLLVARGTSRQKEISMRLTLGASRTRLIRQLLTESFLLAGVAGVAGLLVAEWGSHLLVQLASNSSGPNSIPFDVDVHPDPAVLGFAVAVTALTAILFGLLPAVRSTRLDLIPALKENAGSAGRGGWRAGKLLVIAQLAVSVVLLIPAGLFVHGIVRLNSVDVGYSRENLLLLEADLAADGYQRAQRLPATRKLIEELRSIPGVSGATVSDNGIFNGTDSSTSSLQVDGFTPTRKDDAASNFDQVGPHYFQVVGVPVARGRDFDEHDVAGSRGVAILNDTMARFYFGSGDPLGRYLANGDDRYTIVGVVKDMKERDLKSETERRFYTPLFQTSDTIATFHFEIRTRTEGAQMVSTVRRWLKQSESNIKVRSLQPVNALIDRSISGDRVIAELSGFFGLLVLLLAANGLYGVISYTTARRKNEIGVRMAIGASRGDVLYMVLRETLMLIGAGLVIGVPAALVVSRLIRAMLSGVSASDPSTIAAVCLVLLAVGAAAGFIPANRASLIDSMTALRQE